MESVTFIFVLLIIFQVKHFLADYPLQTKYMLGKFRRNFYHLVSDGPFNTKKKFYFPWVAPLSAHCAVHAVMTYLIAVSFGCGVIFSLYLAAGDFCAHFIMDRIKASPDCLGKYEKTDPKFWWTLGLDQGVHHLTHYALIYFILVEKGIM